MNDLNSILLEGNVVRDPILSKTPSGISVCSFSIGSNNTFNTNGVMVDEVSFFDVETWDSLADNVAESLKKGRGIRIVGRMKQDRWDTTEGAPMSRVKIIAEHVEFRPMKHAQQEIA